MTLAWTCRWLISAIVVLHSLNTQALAQSATVREELRRSDARAMELFRKGKFAEAIPFAEKALELTDKHLSADAGKVAISLTTLSSIYLSANRYPEAQRTLRRLVDVLPRFAPPNSEDFAYALRDLAEAIAEQGRNADAATAYDRALQALESALGPKAPDVGGTLLARSTVAQKLGDIDSAIRLRERGVAILADDKKLDPKQLVESYATLGLMALRDGRFEVAEKAYRSAVSVAQTRIGKDGLLAAYALLGLAGLLQQRDDYGAATAATEEALAIFDAKLDRQSSELILPLTGLGRFYLELNRPRAAEEALLRALKITEAERSADQSGKIAILGNLALVYQKTDRTSEAEANFRKALTLAEKLHGIDSDEIVTPLNNLAGFYERQFKYADALEIFKRALTLAEGREKPNAELLAAILTNIRGIYAKDGDEEKAEPFARRAYETLRARFGEDDSRTATKLGLLGGIVADLGRHDEGEDMQKRALAVLERRLRPTSPALIHPLKHLGDLARKQGRFAEAEMYFRKSMEISASSQGSDAKGVEDGHEALALLSVNQERWALAFDTFIHVDSMRKNRRLRDTDPAPREAVTSTDVLAALRPRGLYHAIVDVGFKAAATEPGRAAEIRDIAFRAAQRGVPSEAGRALKQMAERAAVANPNIAGLIRLRQDLSAEWQALDRKLVAARQLAVDKRDRAQEFAHIGRQAAIDGELQSLATRIGAFGLQANASDDHQTLGIVEVQAHLGPDEVLVFPFSTLGGVANDDARFPGATYIWAITRTDARWVKVDLGMIDIARRVAAIRCGADYTAWQYTVSSKDLCKSELGDIYNLDEYAGGKLPPFDIQRAYELYRALFGGIEDMISGRHIIAVPTFTLNRFPLHALVTAPPKGDGIEALRSAAWLARNNAITVLPTVSALEFLRRGARPSAATRAYLGVANPGLDGPDARYAALARMARDRQHCSDLLSGPQPAVKASERRGAPRIVVHAAAQAHAGSSDVAPQAAVTAPLDVRTAFSPLPETAEEACAVARALKSDPSDVLLGRDATKTALLAASLEGRLANYRILHFATHAALGARLGEGQEPGLVLTPSNKPSKIDDGYLSASDVATLRLDADLVILSACNTARSNTTFLETLTGLSQSFFYAGARSLLVANWEVDSQAAVQIVTQAVGILAAEPGVLKAEALRRAMLAVIDSGAPFSAHPAIWAPFIVVGDTSVPSGK